MNRYLLTTLAFIVIAIPLIVFSQTRLIAADEGFYLLAAKLVREGKLPYLDFFYPQGPLHPYLYGAWGALTEQSWRSARFFSAILGALSVAVLCPFVRREIGLWGVGAFVLLCGSSELLLPWFSLAKPYAPTALALALAFVYFCDSSSNKTTSQFIVGILFLSIATQLRAYSIALLPIFVFVWLRRSSSAARHNSSLWPVALVALSCLPSVILASMDPESFYFNNLGYHLIRVADPHDATVSAKVDILLKALGLRAATRVATLQPALLMVGWILNVGIAVVHRRLPSAASLAAGMLCVVSLLPSPTHLQYFSLAIPFLVISALECARNIHLVLPRAVSFTLFTVGIVAYLYALPQALAVYVTGGPGVNGSNDPDAWSIKNVDDIARSINSLSTPGELVMSEWPGYLYGTHAQPFPGMENHFGFVAAARLDEPSRHKYHILTRPDSMRYVTDPAARVVIVPHNKRRASYETLMSQRCFIEKYSLGSVSLYQSCPVLANEHLSR